MISRGFLLWLGLVIGMILASVQISMKVEALDSSLNKLLDEQEIERDRIRVLRASYAYLTAPDQLRPLVERHLDLHPIRGDQMLMLAGLPERAIELDAPMSGPGILPGLAQPLPPVSAVPPSVAAPAVTLPPAAAEETGPTVISPPASGPPSAVTEQAPFAPIPRLPSVPPVNPPWLEAQHPPVLQPVSYPKDQRPAP
jgi:hypothetical protein